MSSGKQDCLLDSGESQRQRQDLKGKGGKGRQSKATEVLGEGREKEGKERQEKEIKLEMGQRAVEEEKEEGEMRGGEHWGAWGSRGELARSSARSIGPEC